MKLYCYSKKDFVETMKSNNWTNSTLPSNVAVISICCTEDVKKYHHSAHYNGKSDFHYFNDAENVLNLDFDDITTEQLEFNGHVAKCITKEQAEKAVKFIEAHKNCDFYIHCNAGMSRSQAFVKYISEKYHDLNWETRKENPCLYPNIQVCNTLRRVDYEA